jgi:hypothetical protein
METSLYIFFILKMEYLKKSKNSITVTKFKGLNYSHKIPFNRYIIA